MPALLSGSEWGTARLRIPVQVGDTRMIHILLSLSGVISLIYCTSERIRTAAPDTLHCEEQNWLPTQREHP